MPPDRVFGRIERPLRKLAEISGPSQYYKVFERFGRIKLLGRDWQLRDYKEFSDRILTNASLHTREARVWTFNGTNFGTQATYAANSKIINVKKKNCTLRSARVKFAKLVTHVTADKKRDVEKLLQYVTLTEEDKTFYEKALASVCPPKTKRNR